MKNKKLLIFLIVLSGVIYFIFFTKPPKNFFLEEHEIVKEGVEKIYFEHFYQNGEIAYIISEDYKYFNLQGKEIARFNPKTSSGTKIVFQKDIKNNKYIRPRILEEYINDTLISQKLYNSKQEIISTINFKKGKPFNGEIYNPVCEDNYYNLITYKEGIKKAIRTFNNNDSIIGKLSLRKQLPFTGTKYYCNKVEKYINGKLNGLKTVYTDSKQTTLQSVINYKNNKKSGSFLIYNDGKIEKQFQFKDDEMNGNQLFYNLEKKTHYVVTISETQKITSILKFATQTNELLQKYEIELGEQDELSFTDIPENIEIIEKDINQDGTIDLIFQNYFEYHTISSYYLFDHINEKLTFIPEFNNAQNLTVLNKNKIEITTSNTAIDYEDINCSNKIVYNISHLNNIERIKEIKTCYHSENDEEISTQIYPEDYELYPLKNPNLPLPSIIQNGNETKIKEQFQKIELEKGKPFKIIIVGDTSEEHYPNHFFVKTHVTFDKKNLEEVSENIFENYVSYFVTGNSLAVTKNTLAVADKANNIWIYKDGNTHNNLKLEETITDNLHLFSHQINEIPNYNEEKTENNIFFEGTKNNPLYAVIYIDKNRNKYIEEGEFYKIEISIK